MKSFNTYENKLMAGSVYIKLSDDNFLFIGEYEPLALEDEEAPGFIPVNEMSHRRMGIRGLDNAAFKRREEWDGFEFEVPEEYKRPIIKKVLE